MERLSTSNDQTFLEKLGQIREEVSKCAQRCGRDPGEIRVMAVTKTLPVWRVNEAIHAGLTLLGENRAQEMLERIEGYDLAGCELHFIGHLQTNKVRQIVGKADLIESVDSVKLAREISRCCEKIGKTMPILLEVNIAEEESKSGILPQNLLETAEEIARIPHLQIQGLMTMPPLSCPDREREGYFDRIYRQFIDIKVKNIDNVTMSVLSMGTSFDYQMAIRYHATIIRLGRALFGERKRGVQ